MSNTLICPKCGSEMRSYERNEVVVDQCTGCGGLFLDRGELERLVTAESAYYSQPPAQAQPTPSAPQAPPQHHSGDDRGYKDDRYRDDRGYKGKKKKSKRSFLEDIFDM